MTVWQVIISLVLKIWYNLNSDHAVFHLYCKLLFQNFIWWKNTAVVNMSKCWVFKLQWYSKYQPGTNINTDVCFVVCKHYVTQMWIDISYSLRAHIFYKILNDWSCFLKFFSIVHSLISSMTIISDILNEGWNLLKVLWYVSTCF